jgi:ABC-type multidrug transport system permease subunit
VLNVVLGGVLTPGYSHLRHAVSELTQAGAKNSVVLLSALFILSALCFLGFGAAVYRKYHRRRERVAVGGIVIELYAVQAVLLASVFPQDPIGSEATFPGTMHLVLVGTSALCIVAAILLVAFGVSSSNARHWRGFRLYSILSLVVMLVSGASTGILIANGIDLLGLAERVTQLAYLQWFVVAAYKMYLDPAAARR